MSIDGYRVSQGNVKSGYKSKQLTGTRVKLIFLNLFSSFFEILRLTARTKVSWVWDGWLFCVTQLWDQEKGPLCRFLSNAQLTQEHKLIPLSEAY